MTMRARSQINAHESDKASGDRAVVASIRPRLSVVEKSGALKSPDVSTLSVIMGKDRLISHDVDIHPSHRREIAEWLTNLARRIGAIGD